MMYGNIYAAHIIVSLADDVVRLQHITVHFNEGSLMYWSGKICDVPGVGAWRITAGMAFITPISDKNFIFYRAVCKRGEVWD